MIVNSSLVTFYKNPDQDNQYCVDIRDLDNSGPTYYALKRFTYESDVEADEGSLVVQENAILIAPHNKMLNRLDGVWYLNDFVSTTPVVRSSSKNIDKPPKFDEVNTTLSEGVVASASITCTVGASATGIVVFKIGDTEYTATDILNGDAPANVAEALFSAIPGGNVSPKSDDIHIYELTGLGSDLDALKITKKRPGVSTQTVTIVTNTTGASITPTNFTGGVDPINSDDGNVNPPVTFVPALVQNQEYAYTARYVYRDGHKTKTAFPVYIKTTTERRFNALEIDASEDIDDKLARIEIFRKTKSDNFFLIGSFKPIETVSGIYFFYDDGKPDLTVLDEEEYVWTTSHKTHAVLRDRYIRANVEYGDRDFDVSGIVNVTTSTLSMNDPIVPSNCRVDVFARKRQEDGLLSFHKLIGGNTVDSLSGDLSLSVKQNAAVADAKEVALYAKYKSLEPVEFLSFSTPELYNINIPSIATYDKELKDQPANPHILLGWRYITAIKGKSGGVDVIEFVTYDEDWDTKPAEKDNPNDDRIVLSNLVGTTTFPSTYTFNLFGTELVYFPKYTSANSQVYEMAIFDGLKEAVSRNKIKISLSSIPSLLGGTLSTELPNTEFFNLVVDVVGISDTSTGNIRLIGKPSNQSHPYGPKNSRVYLLLASDSVFSRIDNASMIKYTTYKRDLDSQDPGNPLNIVFPTIDIGLPTSPFFTFKLYGAAVEFDDDSITPPSQGNGYAVYPNNYYLTDLSGDVVSNALIYLGKSTNTTSVQSPLRTGYTKVITNNFITNEVAESNIYETLVTADQLGVLQNEFPNQIIWSDPYVVGTDVSGNRTFSFTNFLSLQRDYGDIVRIEPIANRLLVFCERGVAVVMVGEVLTETVSGQTFVNAVNFLNSPTWILKNIKGIQSRSIKQYEGTLFFSDGQDVWMFGEGLSNISQGAITLAGPQVGAIDVLNQEYRISGGEKTYSYSIPAQQWSGPHTYEDKLSTTYKDRTLSVIHGFIVEHNKGNKFAGESYETIVESVANELNEASLDKIYRKFYIEHENAETFEYGKDYTDMTSKAVADAATKQGLSHIGVNPSNATARQIFWRIKSAVEGFKLKMISFNWTPRSRR